VVVVAVAVAVVVVVAVAVAVAVVLTAVVSISHQLRASTRSTLHSFSSTIVLAAIQVCTVRLVVVQHSPAFVGFHVVPAVCGGPLAGRLGLLSICD
jgi:hypothetical protein